MTPKPAPSVDELAKEHAICRVGEYRYKGTEENVCKAIEHESYFAYIVGAEDAQSKITALKAENEKMDNELKGIALQNIDANFEIIKLKAENETLSLAAKSWEQEANIEADHVKQLKSELAEARKVIGFYADKENWYNSTWSPHSVCDEIVGDSETEYTYGEAMGHGGKRAREYLNRHKGGV